MILNYILSFSKVITYYRTKQMFYQIEQFTVEFVGWIVDREKSLNVETLEAGQIQFAGLLSGIWNV